MTEILEEAMDLDSSEVPELLDRRCGSDAELRAEVERLLGVYNRVSTACFMESAATGWVVPARRTRAEFRPL